MNTIKSISAEELRLFRDKMILVYNNGDAVVKAEASVVLSMIKEELLIRSIETGTEKLLAANNNTFSAILLYLKSLFHRNTFLLNKKGISYK